MWDSSGGERMANVVEVSYVVDEGNMGLGTSWFGTFIGKTGCRELID